MRATAATHPGGSRNQDAHAVLPNAAVVLDGASSFVPTDNEKDGGWYAASLLAELTQRITDPTAPLRQCLRDAITAMRDDHGATPGGPSSTVLIARWTHAEIELLVLGDSTIVVERNDGSCDTVTDTRLSRVAPHIREEYKARLATGQGMDSQHQKILARLQREQRRHRNQAHGYWIAETDPRAADYAQICSVPTTEVERVLLATDGAAAAVKVYRSPGDWSEYLTVVRRSPARAQLTTHRLERTDPGGRRWPRAKCHDDKTVVLLEPY